MFFCLLTIGNVDNRQWRSSPRCSGARCGNRGCGGIRGGTDGNGCYGDAPDDERLSQPAVYSCRMNGEQNLFEKVLFPGSRHWATVGN